MNQIEFTILCRKRNKTRIAPAAAVKKAALIAGALLLAISVALALPDNKDKPKGRLLYGKVLDQQDNPVVGAIVYLTNTRTHAVKTYIVSQEGTYRFPGLSTVDYEVYAQYNGKKSDTKSVSQFDDRTQVYIDLKIQGH
ncbi:MAG: carboxypeptidase-like regulatory domain-containing protein [Candidatus Sulfotelmatobacter sp.]